jgi:peptidyl-prolyl cis-trans isomerase B (cyclophilin B)
MRRPRFLRPVLACLAVMSVAASAMAEDWTDLREDYDAIRNYLTAKKRIGDGERASLVALQARLDAFRVENPQDGRPIAMGLQIAEWLGDEDRLDADYEALAGLSDNDRIQVRWATHRLGMNRYDDVAAIIQRSDVDLAAEPEAGILLARACMARNRFQDAIDAIDAIPEDGLKKPGIRGRANRIRGEASRWLALWSDELALRAAEEAEGTAPIMQLVTSKGPVTILLFEDQAPNTVANFIELAEKDFFDGTRFHRVEKNFVVQGGDPNSRPGSAGVAGSGGRGARIPDESGRPDKRYHFAGAVAMAKSPDPQKPGSTVKDSGSSQFYVVLEPMENLNAEYTVFGRVIDGIGVIEAIRRDDELTDVATVSRPDRPYVAETLALPGIPKAGTPLPDEVRTKTAESDSGTPSDANGPADP